MKGRQNSVETYFFRLDGLSELYILINRFNSFNIFQGVSKKPPGEAFTS